MEQITVKTLTIRENGTLIKAIGINNESAHVNFELDVSKVKLSDVENIIDYIEDGIWYHDSDAVHAEGQYGEYLVAIEDFPIS